MSSLMYQANATLNAMDEARVGMLIEMIKTKKLNTRFPTLAENVADWADAAGVKDIDYWVHEFYCIPRLTVQDTAMPHPQTDTDNL